MCQAIWQAQDTKEEEAMDLLSSRGSVRPWGPQEAGGSLFRLLFPADAWAYLHLLVPKTEDCPGGKPR